MKIVNAMCAAALAVASAPLAAQGAPAAADVAAKVVAGASVYDTAGGTVGTIASVTNGIAVVDTGTNKVGLPLASFAAGDKGPIIAMTKSQLDDAANKATADAKAALKAQLTPGATVTGSGGATIGTVKEADDQYVTVTMPKGPVRLPIGVFTNGASGPMLLMTAADLDKAIAAVSPGK